MTINTLQQLSQLTSTKISINIYSYKTRDVHKQKSYKCYTCVLSLLQKAATISTSSMYTVCPTIHYRANYQDVPFVVGTVSIVLT